MTIVPDPGVLLNLVASQCSAKICTNLGARVVIPEQFRTEKLLFDTASFPTNSDPELQSAMIEIERLDGETELQFYAEMSPTANEAEAASAALAAARGWTLATDDPVLRSAFSQISSIVPLSTLGIFRLWEPYASPQDFVSSALLLKEKAAFYCAPDDPDACWWMKTSRIA